MAHVSMLTLGVEDLGRAATFYEALGWRRSSASQESVVFLTGGAIVLGLFGREDLAEDGQLDPSPDGYGNMTIASNQPSREAVDEVMATAEAAGARISKPAQEVFWGGYSGYFVDLDGHVWEVAHNPFAPLDADGRMSMPD